MVLSPTLLSYEFIEFPDSLADSHGGHSKIVIVTLQTDPAPPPNSGMADTLDEAKAAFAKRYAEVKQAN